MVLAWAWAPVQHGVNTLGNWLVASGPVGPFVYGVLNVIFRVVGLHHIVNSLVWFVFGTFTPEQGAAVTGDIHRFNLATPGRGEENESASPFINSSRLAAAYLDALGGKKNLIRVDACITRLRLEIVDRDMIQEPALKKLGAMGVIKRGDSGLQVIIGTQAEIIASEIRELLNQ